MNSVYQDIFKAIHEGKWLSIEYKKNEQTTKYWIGIRDVNIRKKTLAVEGMHLAEHTIQRFDYIYIDSIISSSVIEGTYYEVNRGLVEDIYLNPHKYMSLFENVANLKILNYLEDCNRMDTTPYKSDFELVRYLDGTIDMYLRNIITKMCIDIEHDLKVILLKNLEMNTQEDGYTIVDTFLSLNPYIVGKIEAASASPFTGDLIQKYFTVQRVFNQQKNRNENRIMAFDCPVWVLMEILTFGDFIHFYEYYYSVYDAQPISTKMINLVKSLRNGCAHNNCIIADLNAGTSRAPAEINRMVKLIPEIKQNQKRKKLSCRSILEFVCMLYVYNNVVSEKVKRNRIVELKLLFNGRIPEKRAFFKKNELVCSSYRFVKCIIEHIFG